MLVTLDKGFGDIRRYGDAGHSGMIVVRPLRQDKDMCHTLFERVLSVFAPTLTLPARGEGIPLKG